MREIKYIEPLKTSFIISIVTVIVAAITSFALSIMPIILAGTSLDREHLFYWLFMPLMTGAVAFFSTIASCVIYNFLAKKFGGINILIS
jgi:ABC-type polysaccharide/polyol phosphate export permease